MSTPSNTVAIIDYGMGNLHSVAKALEHVADPATRVMVTSDPDTIVRADRVVLPGVGAVRHCMTELQRRGLDAALREVAGRKPLLGVCVGMQVLMDTSEENGGTECLGILPGRVLGFAAHMPPPAPHQTLKVPHIGWNQVHQSIAHPLWRHIPQDARFYFVHSYYVEPATPELIAGFSIYPVPFTAAVAQGPVFATQFHPEKSQQHGLALYRNFLDWDGSAPDEMQAPEST